MIGALAPPPRPPPPPPRPAPLSRRVTGEPGFVYAASCLRSHTLRGAAPGSMIHVRVMRVARSVSVRSAMPVSVKLTPPYRHSVFVNSVGAAVNGADTASTLSRNGTFTRLSPLSRASTHMIVAGWSARHWKPRGPGSTPVSVVPSRDATSTSFFDSSPARVQISTTWAKPFIGTVCENGFLIRVTSMYWPLGDGVTPLRMPGVPMADFAPVVVLTAVSWLVKRYANSASSCAVTRRSSYVGAGAALP